MPVRVIRVACVLPALIAWVASPQSSPAQSPATEVRAMWISRFEWPDDGNPNTIETEATIKARIDAYMQQLAAHHFNAVFFQVRGQADVFYPSPDEPWSPLINNGVDPGWDPLAYAIQSAHSNGLRFHAYINTHTCWQSSSHKPPAAENHPFKLHCDASDPARRDWLIHDSAGNPVQWHENDYVWIAPGVPEFQAYIRKQVLHVVENYDVDGVHFDRIRTPNSNFSYDPISQARRASPQSNPNNLDFSHWTRDQITRNVRDIYAAIMAVKPHVVVSAAVFPDPFSAPAGQHQDALTWAQTGGLDMIVPMMYSAGGEGSTWDNRLKAWLAGSAGRQVVAGQITSVGTSTLLTQVDLTRTRAAAGNSVFSISSFASWADYLASVYQAPAALPAMAWKSAPEHGIIIGYVTGAAGEAVVDAQLRRDGSDYVGLSSGDGFYSFLLVPPGTYRVQASHPGYGTVQVENVSVAAGQVVRRDINLGERLLPVIAKVEPDPDSVIGGREYIRQLSLIQGIVDTWTLVEGPPGAVINGQGQISGWFPQVSQIGQLFTFTVRATGPDGSDDETWQVRVVPPPPCLIHRFTGFEGHNPGTRVLFQLPRYSGTTGSHLATSPNVSEVTDEVTAFKGDRCLKVQWQFVDTATSRWMRLTASNGPVIPNPTVPYDRPIRFRLRVDHGSFRLCVGIRETNTTAAIGEDGGSEGPIEWVGAAASNGGAPQGRLVQAQPGVWQTFEFNPLTDPVVSFTGDGHLPVDGKGVFEHIAFASVGDPGPFTVYIDDIDLGCYSEPFGDFNRDGHVDALDLSLFAECASGPSVPLQAGCEFADANGDGFVDVNDFAAWQRCYSGVLPQLDPDCAP